MNEIEREQTLCYSYLKVRRILTHLKEKPRGFGVAVKVRAFVHTRYGSIPRLPKGVCEWVQSCKTS